MYVQPVSIEIKKPGGMGAIFQLILSTKYIYLQAADSWERKLNYLTVLHYFSAHKTYPCMIVCWWEFFGTKRALR